MWDMQIDRKVRNLDLLKDLHRSNFLYFSTFKRQRSPRKFVFSMPLNSFSHIKWACSVYLEGCSNLVLSNSKKIRNTRHVDRKISMKNLTLELKKAFRTHRCAKSSFFSRFSVFLDVKKLHSQTREPVIEKILLGSNRAYMSQSMKFFSQLHWARCC